MSTITIVSPDKISLGMFADFFRRNVGAEYLIGDLHYLMDKDSFNSFLDGMLEKSDKTILRYYIKRRADVNVEIIPSELMDKSDVVVWFQLYATKPDVLKDTIGFMDRHKDNWDKFVEMLSK